MSEKAKLEALAAMIASELRAAPPRPKLRLVTKDDLPRPMMDSVTRDAMLGRVRDLRRMFNLGWLVRQETFAVGALECLDDRALSALLRDMERARECLRDDVTFEDAGLVRSPIEKGDEQWKVETR